MSRARLSRLTCGALAVAVGLLAVHLLWWSRPTAYAPYGSSIRGPAQVEETRLISLLLSDPTRDVTVHAPNTKQSSHFLSHRRITLEAMEIAKERRARELRLVMLGWL